MKSKVLIGLPSYRGEFHPLMTTSLDKLIQHTRREQPEMDLAVRKQFGTVLCVNRNKLAQMARTIKATHLLFIDSDMVFDEDALLRLLAHDRDIVSGLCTQKVEPYAVVAKRRDDKGAWKNVKGLEDGRFYSDLDGVGCAFTLIKTRVFDDVGEPWFAMPPLTLMENYPLVLKADKGLRSALSELVHQDKPVPIDTIRDLLVAYEWKGVDHGYSKYVIGEDVYFSDKARCAGFEVCLDASLVIGHIGEHVYSIDDYVEYKKQREINEKAEGAA